MTLLAPDVDRQGSSERKGQIGAVAPLAEDMRRDDREAIELHVRCWSSRAAEDGYAHAARRSNNPCPALLWCVLHIS